MHTGSIHRLRSFYTSQEKSPLRFPILLIGWMALTFLGSALLTGYVTDGILRTILEGKDRELLASRQLSVTLAFRDTGLPGVQHLLRNHSFANDYIRLTNRQGDILLDQNPRHVRFTRPLRPMPTLSADQAVPDWSETATESNLDYDLLTSSLPDGAALLMGLCEEPQEKFLQRCAKLSLQIGGTFLALSLVGAALFLRSRPFPAQE